MFSVPLFNLGFREFGVPDRAETMRMKSANVLPRNREVAAGQFGRRGAREAGDEHRLVSVFLYSTFYLFCQVRSFASTRRPKYAPLVCRCGFGRSHHSHRPPTAAHAPFNLNGQHSNPYSVYPSRRMNWIWLIARFITYP